MPLPACNYVARFPIEARSGLDPRSGMTAFDRSAEANGPTFNSFLLSIIGLTQHPYL